MNYKLFFFTCRYSTGAMTSIINSILGEKKITSMSLRLLGFVMVSRIKKIKIQS